MEEYEYINTELGLAIQGNFIYNKNSKFPTSMKPEEEDEEERPRKKLRLSKEQSAFLEGSYRAHNIPTSNQKREVAEKLNLRPHQVEVWFQNRRARTKINQMKMECDYLKELCDSLSNENQRLQRELFELRRWVKPEPTPQAN